jgi:hypothetical protein
MPRPISFPARDAATICSPESIASFVSHTSAVDALHRALRDAAPTISDLSRNERMRRLRGPTLAAVDELKREGLSAMRVHLTIQALARNAGIRRAEGGVVDELRTWSAMRYFASNGDSNERRK